MHDKQAFEDFIKSLERVITNSKWGNPRIDGEWASSIFTVSITLDFGKIKSYENVYSIGESKLIDFISKSDIDLNIYDEATANYIDTLILNETTINSLIAELDPSSIFQECDYVADPTTGELIPIQEAIRLQDEVRNKWKLVVDFINNINKRFTEMIVKLLGSNKTYLEKYRKIILNIPWRSDQTFEYNGNYIEAVNRCKNTHIPEFSYPVYAQALRADGYGEALKMFMRGKGFKYDARNKNLAEQFKSYFLALEYGVTRGKFSDLNPIELYNFCYNSRDLLALIEKDKDIVNRASNALIIASNKVMRDNGQNPNSNTVTNTTTNTTTSNTDINKTSGGAINASYTIDNTGKWVLVSEADRFTDNTNSNPATSVENQNKRVNDTGLKLKYTGSNASEVNGAIERNKNSTNTSNQDMNVIMDKWITMTRAMIAAKYTAVQKIAKDYMDIIRAHVQANLTANS